MTTKAIAVAPSNAEQAAAWDGPEGRYWALHADRFDRSVAAYQDSFMRAAQIEPGSRVLDIGCGAGQTTREAARLAVEGHAVGVDLSAAMVQVARSRAAAEDLRNVTFLHADAQVERLGEQTFDRAISRTGSMFFADPAAAFANIGRGLAPGALLTLLVWQAPDRNEWIGALATALLGRAPGAPPPGAPGPFSLSDPTTTRELLTSSGLEVVSVDGMTEPMHYGSDVADAHEFVLGLLGWMLEGRDADDRRRAHEDLRATLDEHLTSHGVQYQSAAWLVTARRG